MLYRTFWQRVAASFIDGAILLPLLFFNTTGSSVLSIVSIIAVLLLQHGYYIIGHAQFGQTLGKRLLNVRVVRAHHELPVRWKEAFMRELLWIGISIMYLVTKPADISSPFIVGFSIIVLDALMAFVHPSNRSLRDFIGKTVVVRTDMVEQ